MNLSHFSDAPIQEVYSVQQTDSRDFYRKPRGLWLSVDGEHSWEEWCRSERFGDKDAQYQYRIHLKGDANILHISGEDAIDAFHAEYGQPHELSPTHRLTSIQWDVVAKKYQGIIIAPYLWERRLAEGFMWYYGWDCASGCIWDASAVDRIELVREPMEKAA